MGRRRQDRSSARRKEAACSGSNTAARTAPVALLKTYDATRGAQGSVDAPLSMRDSATAGTDNDDLTIVGIPGGTQRRVNLGIVNVGKIPAIFRITVRTRTGQQIGKTFEEGLGEDASRMIADIEKTLGVAIDETTAVHVTMTAGTGVAYVSIVNGWATRSSCRRSRGSAR